MGVKLSAFTLREEHKLRVSENRVLRRMFGPRREKVTGEGETLHNDELHNLYASPHIMMAVKTRGWDGLVM
jgi:hypothetical protein